MTSAQLAWFIAGAFAFLALELLYIRWMDRHYHKRMEAEACVTRAALDRKDAGRERVQEQQEG